MENPNVLAYIPQRPPFVMVGEVISSDELTTQCQFLIPADNVLVQGGYFTESGLVENMAQTAASGTGYKAAKENKPAPVGFIGAIKRLTISYLPAVGDTITTTVTTKTQVLNAVIADAAVMLGTTQIASCELKIFIQE